MKLSDGVNRFDELRKYIRDRGDDRGLVSRGPKIAYGLEQLVSLCRKAVEHTTEGSCRNFVTYLAKEHDSLRCGLDGAKRHESRSRLCKNRLKSVSHLISPRLQEPEG